MNLKKILVILLTIIIITTGCSNSDKVSSEKKETKKYNKNENVIKVQTIDNFVFDNISLVYQNKTSTFDATITNSTDVERNISTFKIIFKDEKENIISELYAYVGDTIGPNETKSFSTSELKDLTNAYSVEYQFNE